MKVCVLPATYNLQHNDSKAEYIGLCWEKAVHHILRRHITTGFKRREKESFEFYQKDMLHDKHMFKYTNAGITKYTCAYKHTEVTYYVPTTRFVLARHSFPDKILAKPKSDILGFI